MSEILVDQLKFRDGTLMGALVGSSYYQTGEMATGTTTIPYDDTIPQSSEGTQFMSLAHTPRSATNVLKVSVTFWFAVSAANTDVILALFKNSDASAVAAVDTFGTATNYRATLNFTYFMVAGTTDPITFKVRAGPGSAATVTFNGSAAARKFGGVACSSITVEEIQGE